MHDCALAIHWRYISTTRKYFFFLSRISPPRPPGWSWIRIFVWRKVTIERPKYLWVAIFLIAGRNIGGVSCFSSENKWFAGEPLCLLAPPANSQARPISQCTTCIRRAQDAPCKISLSIVHLGARNSSYTLLSYMQHTSSHIPVQTSLVQCSQRTQEFLKSE